jgi:hypothetical protein
MPTSTYAHIAVVAEYLEKIRPESVLDIGVGNGKMGFIARDLLDVMLGQRFRRSEWTLKLDGIEAFPEYIQPHQRAIYDEIHVGDAFEVLDTLGRYDAVILGDVLEHFEPERAHVMLRKCVAHADKAVILSIPLGERWTQEDIYDNPYERHLSFWTRESFEEMAIDARFFTFAGLGLYGSFLITPASFHAGAKMQEADGLFAEGRTAEAIAIVRRAIAESGASLPREIRLVEFLVRAGSLSEAVAVLEGTCARYPDDVALAAQLRDLRDVVGGTT